MTPNGNHSSISAVKAEKSIESIHLLLFDDFTTAMNFNELETSGKDFGIIAGNEPLDL
jgi:hypothetical protein